ncbi:MULTISPECIES: sodium:proton antiporter NhaD [Corallincola]|uniref:Sodium:proton antiporter n=3 Tax=Corallincola TaxID=1775176 RepID=A0A368N8E2_9GAMM|nr:MULTISPECIES: sodium:proton antiporter NhaD [Corallincola]RCU45529.1 sodium:proton antiporter [Corallincola holothuriorum]TAA40956.1 sodium:proton antiporter [Corallincola spongiicola]TCI02587.1 sodium:proton antiporter [Corallincola luteus]
MRFIPNASTLRLLPVFLLTSFPCAAFEAHQESISALSHPLAIFALCIFFIAYALVIFEEQLNLPKSKPMINAAGILWVLAALVGAEMGMSREALEAAVTHNLSEFAELFLFLLVAMIYINALEERNVFEALKGYLVGRGLSYQQLFWATSIIAFFLSPIADNLTTALIMGAVVMAVGKESSQFIGLTCIAIVIAANAGGAFSPFGDITTLMVWQSGRIEFTEFFQLFLPAIANYIVPALIISRFIPAGKPPAIEDRVKVKRGGYLSCLLFITTICLAVTFENALGLPPYLGMMFGLSLLFLSIYLGSQFLADDHEDRDFNTFSKLAVPEWDTLLFFFGVMYCVGALGFLGYLTAASGVMYGDWGATPANIAAGVISSVIDNIPVMFAILTMAPEMDHFQWLLITFTAGVGGSLLSVGSAAGVALMGAAKGHYTFMSHLKWSWTIALGYGAGIGVHFLVNG